MRPITRIDEYLAVISQDEDATGLPDQAVTRIDMYLSKIAGEAVAELPEPVTRIDRYLASIAGMDVVMYDPITRIDYYLAAVAGVYSGELPEPVTRIDHYLYNWASGSSLPWQTFTGNPLQFDAPKAHTLRSAVVAFSPKQDLHGYDAPWPAGGGANIFDKDATQITSLAGIDFTKICYCSANVAAAVLPSVTTIGFSSGCQALGIPVKNGDVVKIYLFNGTASTPRQMYVFTDASGNIFASRTQYNAYGNVETINISEDAYMFLEWAIGTDVNDGIVITKNETAVQTKWTPYSNICPISGRTGVDIYGAGENLWDTSKAYDGPNYSTAVGDTISLTETVLGYSVSGNTISFTATGNWQGIVFKTPYLKAGNYNLHCSLSDGFRGKTFAVGADNKVKEVKFIAYATTNLNYTVGEGDFLCVWIGRSTAGDLTVTDYQIELGSSFTEWHEPKPISTTTLSFPSTVYGGTAEVAEDGTATGSGTWTTITLNGTQNINNFQESTNTCRAYLKMDDMLPNSTTTKAILCDKLPPFAPDYSYSNDVQGISENKNVASNGLWIRIKKSELSEMSLNGIKAWLQANPVTVAYKMRTPSTFTVTASSTPTAVAGINTMWTDGDNLTVEARAEAVNLNALQSLNMLLGGRYVNNHTEEDLSDEEALRILMGG